MADMLNIKAIATPEPIAQFAGAQRNAIVAMKSNGVLLHLTQGVFERVGKLLLRHLNDRSAMGQAATGACLLDVGRPSEFYRDKLPGAINAPPDGIRRNRCSESKQGAFLRRLLPGRTGSVAAFILAQSGYDVSVLEGGFAGSGRPRRKKPGVTGA